MRRSLIFVFGLPALMAGSDALAQELIDPPNLISAATQQIPSGHKFLVAAELGTSVDILGRAFKKDLSPTGPDGRAARVFEPKVKEIPARQFDLQFEMIENSIQLGAHANYLFLRAGVKKQQDRRYMVLRASYIDKIVILEPEGDARAESDLFAAKVFYGWALYVVVDGDKSAFTSDVAAKLLQLGLGFESEARNRKLSVHIHTIGLEAKNPGAVVLPTSAEDIPKLFKTAEPSVPISVEYVTRRPLVADALSWESSVLKPGQTYRMDVMVEVLASKGDGRPWDAAGGSPDPVVSLFVDGRWIKGCKEQDAYVNQCLTDIAIAITDQTTIELGVIDKDLSDDDPIGSAGPVILAGKARVYEPLELPTQGQVKTARLTFRPVK